MLKELYVLYYLGEPILYGKRKKIYTDEKHLNNAITHLTKRNVRQRINSWKDYTELEKNEMLNEERKRFSFAKYVLEK